MAIVPGQPIQDATGGIPRELQPTQADLLMAAAIMHQQGRFQVAGDVVSMPGAATPQERVSKALKTDDLNKLTTNRALMRSLGGGARVLPIKPDDD